MTRYNYLGPLVFRQLGQLCFCRKQCFQWSSLRWSRMYLLLHLRFLYFTWPHVLSHYPISPCRNHGRPIKKRNVIWWQILIMLLLLSHMLYIFAWHILFWWTWWESNPCPECLTLQLCPFKDYNNSLSRLDVTGLCAFHTLSYFKPYTLSFL